MWTISDDVIETANHVGWGNDCWMAAWRGERSPIETSPENVGWSNTSDTHLPFRAFSMPRPMRITEERFGYEYGVSGTWGEGCRCRAVGAELSVQSSSAVVWWQTDRLTAPQDCPSSAQRLSAGRLSKFRVLCWRKLWIIESFGTLRRVCWFILADVWKDRVASNVRSVQSKKGLLDPEEGSSQLLHGNYLPIGAFPSQKTLQHSAAAFWERLLLVNVSANGFIIIITHALPYSLT